MTTNPKPPKEFVSALRAFDSTLRIRWAHRTKVWTIERKMEPRAKALLAERPNPFSSPRGLDLYDGWKDGYVHVLNVHPDLLDHQVFQVLAESDAWRAGSMDKLVAKIEEAEAAEEASQDRHRRGVNRALASEAYDRLAWLQGRRVSMYEPEPAEPVGEQRDGYVVVDRRQVTA